MGAVCINLIFLLLVVAFLLVSLLSSKVYHDIKTHEIKNKMMIEEPPWELSSIKKKESRLPINKALLQDFKINAASLFCVNWNTNSDLWWTHHPEWTVSVENQTHYCFSLIVDQDKRSFYRRLYELNHHNDAECSDLKSIKLLSKGWGADLSVVADGMLQALIANQPARVYADKPWHYAAKKDGSRPICPRMDLSCYFLNSSSCTDDVSGGTRIRNKSTTVIPKTKSISPPSFYAGTEPTDKGSKLLNQQWWWVYEYLTRPQSWLRYEVYQQTQSVNMRVPCTAMHIRRGDVKLELRWKRRYYDMNEYIHAVHGSTTTNILLLTDDENAINEALNFSDYHWMYIDRPRFKGDAGGYENQIPSSDPKQEVVALLAAFQLVRRCNVLVHTKSHFADYLYHEMENANPDKGTTRVNLDAIAKP